MKMEKELHRRRLSVRSHYLLVKGCSQPSPKPLTGSRRLRSASLLTFLLESPHLLNQTGSQWAREHEKNPRSADREGQILHAPSLSEVSKVMLLMETKS